MARKINRDARPARGVSTRRERARTNRELTEDRELTDEERLDALRMQAFQSHLPNLPQIPGYHVCWLTTTNPRDPIFGRVRLGYEPIKSEDVPGFEHATLKSGEWEGCIGVNEMVAFKIPLHLYEMYMTEVHHTAPQGEEEKIHSAMQEAAEQAKRVNKAAILMTEEGTAALGQVPAPPPFAESYGEE